MAKLLIVDDEPTFQEMIKPFFELKGHTVFTAVSAEEAIPEIEKEKPEVIFLDMHLKGKLNGMAVLREVKDKSPGSKIIMLTGMEDNLKGEVLGLGAYKFLNKPVKIQVLNEVVEEILSKSG